MQPGAFTGSAVESVTLFDNLQQISDYAFENCTYLRTLHIKLCHHIVVGLCHAEKVIVKGICGAELAFCSIKFGREQQDVSFSHPGADKLQLWLAG